MGNTECFFASGDVGAPGVSGNAVSGMVVFAFIPQQEYLITHFLRVETLYWKILIINLVSGFLKVKRFETLVKADEVNVR